MPAVGNQAPDRRAALLDCREPSLRRYALRMLRNATKLNPDDTDDAAIFRQRAEMFIGAVPMTAPHRRRHSPPGSPPWAC